MTNDWSLMALQESRADYAKAIKGVLKKEIEKLDKEDIRQHDN